jgi:predicted dehydrogenase/threonine dehydrogenase-like Zn-dependent dehydrogenase
MKQVTQRLRDGSIEVLDVPAPELSPHGVLVDVRASLLSAGTERSKVETARQNLVGKARARPDQVRQVIDKARREGVSSTVAAVRMRLDQPTPLGYSAAGVAIAVGARVRDIRPGDRVACGGADYAVHADVDHVPANLCVCIPDSMRFADAAYATVGSIALQAVRQADVRLGERVAVIGLGLVGQLTAQLLQAAGCEVVGIDLAAHLVERAVSSAAVNVGYVRDTIDADEPPAGAAGCDAVIITAATRSDDPVQLAAALCRDRGRVVVVGDVALNLPRSSYYGKELDLRLSRSYGPGRYDHEYEERGLDYPIGYVRWTERRNMQAVIDLLAKGALDVARLTSAEMPVEEAPAAYEHLLASQDSPLGIVLTYPPSGARDNTPQSAPHRKRLDAPPAEQASFEARVVGLIGAGSFAQGTLVPALTAAGMKLGLVASGTGVSAKAAADRWGFERPAAPAEVIASEFTDLIVIATRHDTHARYALDAIRRDKPVFVEKPPALHTDELEALRTESTERAVPIAVGFNRRHAPLAGRMRDWIRAPGRPIDIVYRVSAGPLPKDHWLKDAALGGGRLIGEGCHFVDFACWLAGSLPSRVSAGAGRVSNGPIRLADEFSVTLEFNDGSLAVISYGSHGAPGLGKERVEVHSGTRSAVIADFREIACWEGRRRRQHTRGRPDKGHRAQIETFIRTLREGTVPPGPDGLATMAVTFAAADALETGRTVSL